MSVPIWASSYELSLLSRTGDYIRPLTAFQSLSMTRTVGSVGALTIAVPYSPEMWRYCPRDAIIDVWRQGARGSARQPMGGVWFISRREVTLDSSGAMILNLSCVDQIDILNRYIVIADAGTPQSDKTGPAETLIKSIVREQLLTASIVNSRPGLGMYLSVEPDLARGHAPMSISASQQSVLSVCTQVARSSAQYGEYLAFDLDPAAGSLAFVFRCRADQLGRDRSAGSPIQTTLSDENGALGTAAYSEDYGQLATFVLCGGQSVSGTPTSATAVSPSLDLAGPFAHTEAYASQQASYDTETLATQAAESLRMARPMLEVGSVTINQSEALQMGVDFDFGDRIVASVGGISLNCRIESLTVAYDAQTGKETITGTLRSEYSP